MLGSSDERLAGALANAVRMLLMQRRRPRGVLAPYAEAIVARIEDRSTRRRDLWLPLLKWCGPRGRAALEALRGDPGFRPAALEELGYAAFEDASG